MGWSGSSLGERRGEPSVRAAVRAGLSPRSAPALNATQDVVAVSQQVLRPEAEPPAPGASGRGSGRAFHGWAAQTGPCDPPTRHCSQGEEGREEQAWLPPGD